MRRLAAGLLTAALMGLLIRSGVRRPSGVPEPGAGAVREEARDPSEGAEARIGVLLESAWRGDVTDYLACFGGPLRQRIEREVGQKGRTAFADDLRRAARARKSHAVFAVEPEGDRAARVVVETVYPDRNEQQVFRLDRGPDGWLITEVETARGQVPKARYGAPATYEEPEGVPVQAGGLAVETGDDVSGRQDAP